VKVLAVINGLGTGGAERSLAESIEPLRRHDIDVHVAALHRREEGVQADVEQATTVHYLAAGRRGSAQDLTRLLRSSDYALVHSALFEADLASRIASLRRVPLLTSLVNTSYDPARLDDPRIRRSRLEAARFLDAVSGRLARVRYHAITDAVAESAVQRLHISRSHITVIPRGRNPERLGTASAERRSRTREALGFTNEDTLVLSVGRQEYQKGQTYLVEALSQLATHRNAHLLIAGREGNASSDINDAIQRSGVQSQVTLLGHLDNVPDLLVAADVLAFPSLFEGLGGTLIEAMALGTPIVAADLPVTREVLGESAMYAAPASADSLARALQDVLTDADLAASLVNRGKTRFAERYNLATVTEQMAGLMRQTAQRNQ